MSCFRAGNGLLMVFVLPDSVSVLEKVVDYFHFWYFNRDKEDVPDMDIPLELCLEILAAADYLGLDSKSCRTLLFKILWAY